MKGFDYSTKYSALVVPVNKHFMFCLLCCRNVILVYIYY